MKKALNPNAAEFVPSNYGDTCVNSVPDVETQSSCIPRMPVTHPSEHSISITLNEHGRQCMHNQLLDDIIPDFRIFEKEENQHLGVSLTALSRTDDVEDQLFSAPWESKYTHYLPEELPRNNLIDEFRSSAEMQDLSSDLIMPAEHDLVIGNSSLNPLEFLGSQFPDLAVQSLADVYISNKYDLNRTIEMLTRLELQFDGNCDHIANTKVPTAPNFTSIDFPALPISHCQPDPLKKSANCSITPSIGFFDLDNTSLCKNSVVNSLQSVVDFASVAKKATQGFGAWECDRSGSIKEHTRNSRSSSTTTSNCGRAIEGRSAFHKKLNPHSIGQTPIWLETGDAVASLYSELRVEAQDHARVRNAYFEQATKAYLVGNKALAKELSLKGQMHNMKMKAAHDKAQKSIYKKRNPRGGEQKGRVSGNKGIIDLHGLHVSEAIHVLKQELSLVVEAARLANQRFEVYVCVGTGHHTRGSHTPARLPVAVQNYLSGEGFEYTEPHPGLLLLSM